MAEPVAVRRRVLIALDSAARCEAVLDAGVRLAAHLRADVEAMFVEDADLLRLAGLPFVREVGRHGAPRGLDPEGVQRALAGYAAEVERVLGDSARRARLQWRFQVAHGRLLHELLAASTEGDLLMLARLGARPIEALRGAAVVSRALAAPVLVVWRDDEAGWRALNVAAEIAELEARPLLVLIAASGPRAAAQTWQRVQAALAEVGVDLRGLISYRQLPDLTPATVADAARVEGADRLIQTLATSAEELEALTTRLTCPLVLVR